MVDLNYEIKISNTADQEFKLYLRNKIKAFNKEVSPRFKQLNEIKAKPFHVVVNNKVSECLGGLTGRVIWDWLEIDYFWISKAERNLGLGKRVLATAEEQAKIMGANKVLLMTFEFQALTFYKKQGYKVVGEIKDYPPGSTYYTLVKYL